MCALVAAETMNSQQNQLPFGEWIHLIHVNIHELSREWQTKQGMNQLAGGAQSIPTRCYDHHE